MRLPYASYRGEEILWLKRVPAHWLVTPLFAVIQERSRPNVGMKEPNLLSLSYGRIIRKDIESAEGLLPETFETYQVVEPGDIVFRFTDLQNDQRSLRTALVNERGIITSAYLAVTPHGVSSRYLAYLMRAYDWNKVFYGMGAGVRQSLRFADVKRMPVFVPPLEEQEAIADFLDEQTSRIDALITKQTQLIATLRERRAGVISRAISGRVAGLNDEGVDWPVLSLRRFVTFLTSGSRGWGAYYADQGARFLRIGNLSRGHLSLRGEVQYVDLPASATEGERTRLAVGDLLFSITAYLGSVGIVPEEWAGAFVSQHVALCRVDPRRVNREFIGWAMLAPSGQRQLKEGAYGGTKQQLALDDIRNLQVPVPPVAIQNEIVDYLKEQVAKIDALILRSEKHIALATERRAALITVAVTGQIDVRTAGRSGEGVA